MAFLSQQLESLLPFQFAGVESAFDVFRIWCTRSRLLRLRRHEQYNQRTQVFAYSLFVTMVILYI